MKYDPERHHRHSIRLQNYDYSRPGTYYVTICARDRRCLFGYLEEGRMYLNKVSQFVVACWNEIPDHFPHAQMDAFVVMPNHVHGIIEILDSVGARHAVPLPRSFGKPRSGSLSTIIGSFKAAVTKRTNSIRNTPGDHVWQRNYYERIIRNHKELEQARQYIEENPTRWAEDTENPANW